MASASWAALRGGPSSDRAYAIVNGVAISSTEFDAYAAVFRRPDGSLGVTREQILQSLVNQSLVEEAADRYGLSVGQDQVREGVDARASLTSDDGQAGGPAGIADRVRMFELFRLVRERVIGPIVVSPEAIAAEYEANPDLAIVPRAEALEVIRERLTETESQRRWEDWLARQRACADIQIVDQSFAMRSSSPGPDC